MKLLFALLILLSPSPARAERSAADISLRVRGDSAFAACVAERAARKMSNGKSALKALERSGVKKEHPALAYLWFASARPSGMEFRYEMVFKSLEEGGWRLREEETGSPHPFTKRMAVIVMVISRDTNQWAGKFDVTSCVSGAGRS